MSAVGTMQSSVKNSRYGSRRPPARSLSAPRIGETMALIPTLTAIATLNANGPFAFPNWVSSTSHRPIAYDTTA